MAETKTPIARDPDKGPPYPLPWTLETKDGDNYIRDATGQAIACDMQYYPWIYSDAMPLIVHAVNSHQDLLDACRLVIEWYENSGSSDPDTQSIGSADLWSTCKKAISKAER